MQFNGQEKSNWIDECDPSSETADPRLTPDNKRAQQPDSWSIVHAKTTAARATEHCSFVCTLLEVAFAKAGSFLNAAVPKRPWRT